MSTQAWRGPVVAGASASAIELRQGRWEDALADVGEVDALILDPPYSERTHKGHDEGTRLALRQRRAINYAHWSPDDVQAFVQAWAPRVRGWFVCLSDDYLLPHYREAYASVGLTTFQAIPCVIPGMTVRLAGDGPSSWSVHANVARPKALCRWGTLPGAYVVRPGERVHIGGKPMQLMRAIVRDYSRPGDLVCDPCAGAATTLIAAGIEGRRGIGAELDPATYALARKRMARGYTQDMFAALGASGAENDNADGETPVNPCVG